MIYKAYAYYNKTIKAYSRPVYSEIPLEYMLESVKRSLHKGSKELKDHILYVIGEFDDNAGTFVPGLEAVLDIDEEIKKYESVYRENK